jgi:hypothetical protein
MFTVIMTIAQKYNMKTDNSPFQNLAKIVSLGTTVTNQNLILEEINNRLHLGNARYLLSSRLLSKHAKIKLYKSVILNVVSHWCETWSLTWRKGIDRRHLRRGC